MTATRSSGTTKNLVTEALKDNEVLSVIKKAVTQALDSKFKELFDRIEKQEGSIFELQNKKKF